MYNKFCLIAIAVLLMSTLVSSFQPSTPTKILKRHGSHTIIRQSCYYKSPINLYQSTQEDTIQQQEEEDDEEDYELVEFFVSPNQIDILRKEANKRKARKALPTFFMPAGDSTEVSEETLKEISNLFETNEIIEIRGISKDKKKLVFDMSYALAETIEDSMEKPVVVVEVKGFAAKLYSPFDNEEQGKRIHLRSSYKPGQWKRKPKAIRDNRGQIILDENGKSIKDVSE